MANLFLTGFLACSKEGIHAWYTKPCQVLVAGRPLVLGKHTTIAWTDDHVVKLPSRQSCLYTHISALPSSGDLFGRRNWLSRHIAVEVLRIREGRELRLQWDIYHPLQDSGSIIKGTSQRTGRCAAKGVFYRWHHCTPRLTATRVTHISPVQECMPQHFFMVGGAHETP